MSKLKERFCLFFDSFIAFLSVFANEDKCTLFKIDCGIDHLVLEETKWILFGPRCATHVATEMSRWNWLVATEISYSRKRTESHKVATCVAQFRNITKNGSRKVAKWVAQSHNMARTKPQIMSPKVGTWVTQSRNMGLWCRKMGRVESLYASNKVTTWVAKSRKMARAK